MNIHALVLLVLFQIKHLLADYKFQTPYMLGKGKSGTDFVLPLGAHCAVHMILSGMIIVCVRPDLLYLCVIEFFAHFMIDRIKATYKLPAGTWVSEERGRNLSKYYFAFGVDQMAHQLCYLLIVYALGV